MVMDSQQKTDRETEGISRKVMWGLLIARGFYPLLFLVSLAFGFQTNFWFGAALFWVIGGAVFLQGLRQIPASPPYVALLTVSGERIRKVKREGWRFFFGYPYIIGFVPVKVEKVNQDFTPQNIRTPDFAELEVPISITWTPDWKNPEALIEFVTTGKEAGVRTILEDIVDERVREWGISTKEGPEDWKAAIASREEAVGILLKAALAEELPRIPSSIPTSILMQYFAGSLPYQERDRKRWGEKWQILEGELTLDLTIQRVSLKELRGAVEKRKGEIGEIRQGNGKWRHPKLGIVLNRLNIGEVRIKGELARAAELAAKERMEREGQTVEIEFVRNEIGTTKDQLQTTTEVATEIVQLSVGQAKPKEIRKTELSISSETRQMIPEILKGLAEFFKGGRGSNV